MGEIDPLEQCDGTQDHLIGRATAALDTSEVFNDEEMQIRKAINANSAVVQNLSRNLAQLTLTVSNKAENDSVEILQQLLDQLRNKVNRPTVQFGDTEGNAKADIEALKKNGQWHVEVY